MAKCWQNIARTKSDSSSTASFNFIFNLTRQCYILFHDKCNSRYEHGKQFTGSKLFVKYRMRVLIGVGGLCFIKCQSDNEGIVLIQYEYR